METFKEKMRRENEEREERTRQAEEAERLRRQREFMWGNFWGKL